MRRLKHNINEKFVMILLIWMRTINLIWLRQRGDTTEDTYDIHNKDEKNDENMDETNDKEVNEMKSIKYVWISMI